jgi:REP element-mobilizing transposase RayT
MLERIHAYMGGIVKGIGGSCVAVGGTANHAHVLLMLPPAVALADAVRTVKCNLSRWVHEHFPAMADFSWQTGYGASEEA